MCNYNLFYQRTFSAWILEIETDSGWHVWGLYGDRIEALHELQYVLLPTMEG